MGLSKQLVELIRRRPLVFVPAPDTPPTTSGTMSRQGRAKARLAAMARLEATHPAVMQYNEAKKSGMMALKKWAMCDT